MSRCGCIGVGREPSGSRLSASCWSALAVLTLMLATPVANGYVVAMSVQEMTDRADLIVRGVVAGAVTTQRGVEVTVDVEQVVKGSTGGASIRIRYPSGLEDTPRFAVGERVLLFLTGLADGTWQVVGGMQGKVRLDAADQNA